MRLPQPAIEHQRRVPLLVVSQGTALRTAAVHGDAERRVAFEVEEAIESGAAAP